MLALAVIGGATADEADRQAVLEFVLQYFPRQFDFITVQLDAFRQQSVTFGVLGTIALVWGALGVFGAVTTAINHAWRVEKTRSYWAHKLFTFIMMLVAGALLIAAVVLVSAGQMVGASWFAGVLGRFPGLLVLRSFALQWTSTALFIVVVALVFKYAPNTKVPFKDVWVGALLTGLLWRGVLFFFSLYVRDMTRFTRVNGSIAAVVVFLVWVYLQAVILLYGAEFTASLARQQRAAVKAAERNTRPTQLDA
jgi:membrane protein